MLGGVGNTSGHCNPPAVTNGTNRAIVPPVCTKVRTNYGPLKELMPGAAWTVACASPLLSAAEKACQMYEIGKVLSYGTNVAGIAWWTATGCQMRPRASDENGGLSFPRTGAVSSRSQRTRMKEDAI